MGMEHGVTYSNLSLCDRIMILFFNNTLLTGELKKGISKRVMVQTFHNRLFPSVKRLS